MTKGRGGDPAADGPDRGGGGSGPGDPSDAAPAEAASAGETPSAGQRLRRSLTDLHVRLRTEGDSPRQHGAAVALGTFVGCLPLFGLHLVLCTVLARLLRLSRVVTYLAAHVNNPLTFPFLLFVELGIGHLLLAGRWPELSLQALRARGFLRVSLEVILGSLVLGLVLGVLFGLLAWAVSRRRRPSPFSRLREAVSERYLGAGVLHWEFVRGKLRWDPMFRGLLEMGVLPRPGTLVDLGCGRGILLAVLATLAEAAETAEGGAEDGKGTGAVPPMELIGVERRRSAARAARAALGDRARILVGDVARQPVPRCDTAALLDVLHYLPPRAQEDLLARVAAALRPGGILILREADDGGGWRFALTRSAERLRAVGRLHLRQRFHYRGRDAWARLLERHGLAVEGRPMDRGTPYANVLLVARKAVPAETPAPAGGSPRGGPLAGGSGDA